MKKLALILIMFLIIMPLPVQAKDWINFTATPGPGKTVTVKWSEYAFTEEPYHLQLEVERWVRNERGFRQQGTDRINLPAQEKGQYSLEVKNLYVYDLDKNHQTVIVRMRCSRAGTDKTTDWKRVDVTEMMNPRPHTPEGTGGVTNKNNSTSNKNTGDNIGPDKGGVFEKAVAELVEAITAGIYAVGGLLEFKPLGTLIMGVGDLNINYPHPFTQETWAIIDDLYAKMTLIAAALYIGLAFATGIKFLRGAMTAKAKEEAIESLWRWLGVLGIIIAAPIIVRMIFVINGYLVSGIASFVTDSAIENNFDPKTFNNLRTGHVLTTALVQILFAIQYFKINLTFIIRDWVVWVLYVFTPLMAVLWGLNKNVTAASVWLGEILSNGFLQTAYSIVLMVILLLIPTDSEKGVLYQVIGVYMLSSLAGMLRNGLQGLWVRWAGIDEERMAGGFTAAMGAMLALPAKAENLHRVAEYDIDSKTGKKEKIYPGDPEIGGGLKPSRQILTDGVYDIGYANEPKAPYGDKAGAKPTGAGPADKGYKTGFDETDFHGTGLIDAINRGRKAYTAVSAGVRTLTTPFLAPLPGGEKIANFAGFAAGKAAQAAALPVTFLARSGMDYLKYHKQGLGAGAAVRGNVAPHFGEGVIPTIKAIGVATGVAAAEWLNPNWTPSVASTLTRRDINNESVWKI